MWSISGYLGLASQVKYFEARAGSTYTCICFFAVDKSVACPMPILFIKGKDFARTEKCELRKVVCHCTCICVSSKKRQGMSLALFSDGICACGF